METFELRYFLAAAEFQNIGQAANKLAVSAPAISRAIGRLEEELGVALFERVGRNVVMSSYGKSFQKEVSRIIGDIDDLKFQFKPSDFQLGISLIGTEFGLSIFSQDITKKLKAKNIPFSLDVKIGSDSKSIERSVLDGESHLGIVTRTPGQGLKKKKLGEYNSKIYVGPGHTLFKQAKKNKPVNIDEVLRFEFASFSGTVFSEEGFANKSADGWRDDKFKRRISLKSESVAAVIGLIEAGSYLSYLPTSVAERRDILPLNVVGCPYTCSTEIYLIARASSDFSWMSALF